MHAIWFRNDLRVRDNPALNLAADNDKPIIGFYIFTPDQHREHFIGNTKLRFMLESVACLSRELKRLGIPLIVAQSSTYSASVQVLKQLCQQYKITQVFANEETELNEHRRDTRAKKSLAQHNVGLHFSQDQTLCPPGTILTGSGQPFRVYTPFKRAWLKTLAPHFPTPITAKIPKQKLAITATPTTDYLNWIAPTAVNKHWPAGSETASARLDNFLSHRVSNYKDERDFPALNSTSNLSPYLAVGSISIKQCFHAALSVNHFDWDSGDQGILCWLNELIWREFYKHLSAQNPDLSKGAPFQSHTSRLRWHNNPEHFECWQRGKTGYPLVDAGMRQLNETGWMHNRLRMVTAMFLTKHLFIDWHWGERYFMEQLIDGDYSANNGGWQWSASTGADAAPYFRVFNPTRQSQRFDPKGAFISAWLPELAGLSAKQIHNPDPESRNKRQYPMPIVDHAKAVAYVKDQFKQL